MSENKGNNTSDVKLENFEIIELEKSNYIKPYRIRFKQNNQTRLWDAILTHPSVSCIIFDTDKDAIILVKQFRPVVYVNRVLESNHDESKIHAESVSNVHELANGLDWSRVDPKEGFTFELCAGICDKSKSLEETIREEIFEECGYRVEKDHPVHKVRTFRGAVGLMGSLHTIFYCEVNKAMKVGPGGGNANEGEIIELFELPKAKIREFIDDESSPKPPGLLFALLWFLNEREKVLAK